MRTQLRVAADDLCVRRAESRTDKRRTWGELRYGAKTWTKERRVVAPLDATTLGLDIRYVVTSLAGTPEHLYRTVYCARGRGELHHAAQDPARLRSHPSCRDPRANQFRLVLHTRGLLATARRSAAALVPGASRVRHAAPDQDSARLAERAARIRVWLPTSAPDGTPFRSLAGRFAAAGP